MGREDTCTLGMDAEWETFFIQHLNKVEKEYSQHQLLSLTTEGIIEKDITDVKGKVPARLTVIIKP